jgi:hypothetical protein
LIFKNGLELKMSVDVRYIDFMQSLRARVKQATAVDKVVAFCVGVAVAKMLPISSEDSASAAERYDTTLTHTADQSFSKFNENCVFDIDTAREVCRGLWLIRSAASNDSANLIIPNTGGSFTDVFFGTRLHLSADTVRFLDQNAEAIAAMANRVFGLLNDGQ